MNMENYKNAFLKGAVFILYHLLATPSFADPIPEKVFIELIRTGSTDYQFKNSEDKAQAFLAVVIENKIESVKRMLSNGYDADSNTRDKLSVLGAAYSFAELDGRPDFAMINLLEEHAKVLCNGKRITFGRESETARITVSEFIATSKNKKFLDGLKSARCPYSSAGK